MLEFVNSWIWSILMALSSETLSFSLRFVINAPGIISSNFCTAGRGVVTKSLLSNLQEDHFDALRVAEIQVKYFVDDAPTMNSSAM
jgi:hypothetical protein